MARYNQRKSVSLSPQFPAPSANPNSEHWKSHTNCSTLPEREFPPLKAPVVKTIKTPPPKTPVSKHGTLASDGGDARLRSRARSDKGSYPS